MNLDEILDKKYTNFNTEDVLNSLIEMQFCEKKNREMLVPFAEYLVTRLISYNKNDSSKIYTWKDYLEIEKATQSIMAPSVREVFEKAHELVDEPDEVKDEFLKSTVMSMKGKVFRGDGYLFQIVELANKLYKPLDSDFMNRLGFRYTTFENCCFYIYKEYAYRVRKAFKKRNRILNIIRTIWNVNKKGESLLNVSVKEGNIFKISKSDLYNKFGRQEITAMLSLLSLQLGDFDCKTFELGNISPLYSKPFVNCNDYVYLPLPTSTFLNMPKIFHYSFVASKLFDKVTVEKYKENRGDVIEDLTIDYLSKFYDRKHIHKSLLYPTRTKIYEADVTIEDLSGNIFCECKSKMLRLPSLQGDLKTLKDDLEKAIGYAYDQARRTIDHVAMREDFIDEHDNVVKIQSGERNYILCVTPENFGNIPFELDGYLDLTVYPIVINVYDLEIVTKECKSKQELLDYFDFRIANKDLLTSFDELDMYGMFRKYGKDKMTMDADSLMVMSFTDKLDRKYNIENIIYLRKHQ